MKKYIPITLIVLGFYLGTQPGCQTVAGILVCSTIAFCLGKEMGR